MTTRPGNRQLQESYRHLGTVNGVADELGVAFETARRWLLEAEIELRPKGRPSANVTRLDAIELAKGYRAGESIAQLGRRFGVSPATVRSRLLAAGVELRPRPGWRY